jgi:hypothetical protein
MILWGVASTAGEMLRIHTRYATAAENCFTVPANVAGAACLNIINATHVFSERRRNTNHALTIVDGNECHHF